MKTAISLPDALFEDAERVAERLGLSRSELYARAIASFVREHSGAALTAAIDRALDAAPATLDPALRATQTRSLGPDEGSFDDWVAPRGQRTAEARKRKRRG